MSARTAKRLALGLWSAAILFTAVGLTFLALSPSVRVGQGFGFRGFPAIFAVSFASVGALIASRRPQNPIGWLLLGTGLGSGLQVLGEEYAVWGILAHHEAPGAVVASWITGWIWLPVTASVAVYVPLLFPTGRLRSARWRPVLYIGAAGFVLFAIGVAFLPGTIENLPSTPNPYGLAGARDLLNVVAGIGAILYAASAALALASLVLRFRDAVGDERQQLKWFVTSLSFVVLSLALSFVQSIGGSAYGVVSVIVIAAFATIPIATGIAVLKYRLYDIDVVINRTVVFGALAAFITAVYVVIVVGIGWLVGTRGSPNLGLSIIATAVVAVAFQPMRGRAQRLANRLVYGQRATPYEILSRFSENVAGTYATQDVLPRMARVLAEGTGGARADIWLRVEDSLRLSASWPEGAGSGPKVLPLTDGEIPAISSAGRVVPVHHHDELLGALAVTKPVGEAFNPAEETLLLDLASQAGLVLRNVRLTAELQARVDEILRQAQELRASRQRIVAAQDSERRRLERNIHDGAQQHLVALAVRLRMATSMATKDPERAASMLEEIQGQAAEALETLRDLARGIYPPVLAEQGLFAALTSQARKLPMTVDVEAGELRRYPAETEAAVYFCCLEALQNVAKYAGASRTVVRLEEKEGALTFAVVDDGAGFETVGGSRGSGLQNMTDRLEALGGTLQIVSAPGQGTTVAGRIPIVEEGRAGGDPSAPAGEGEGQEAGPFAAAQASARRSGPNADLGM
jgi:signal transduction histidine kinase